MNDKIKKMVKQRQEKSAECDAALVSYMDELAQSANATAQAILKPLPNSEEKMKRVHEGLQRSFSAFSSSAAELVKLDEAIRAAAGLVNTALRELNPTLKA